MSEEHLCVHCPGRVYYKPEIAQWVHTDTGRRACNWQETAAEPRKKKPRIKVVTRS